MAAGMPPGIDRSMEGTHAMSRTTTEEARRLALRRWRDHRAIGREAKYHHVMLGVDGSPLDTTPARPAHVTVTAPATGQGAL